MKVGILAGGLGTRLAEETEVRPKPMVEIGGRPILWHIMKHYSSYGFREFAIALGYKGEQIKRFMIDHSLFRHRDLTVDMRAAELVPGPGDAPEGVEDWIVHLVETGYETATGGRIKRLADHLGDGTFMLTWGDGVSDVNLRELLAFHRSHGRFATVTAVRPPARFGKLELVGNRVGSFTEKPQLDEGWINGAFFVLEPEVFDYIDGDDTQWEREPMERLAKDGQLMAYLHHSFWQCMDTVRDKKMLEELWRTGHAPWRTWDVA